MIEIRIPTKTYAFINLSYETAEDCEAKALEEYKAAKNADKAIDDFIAKQEAPF